MRVALLTVACLTLVPGALLGAGQYVGVYSPRIVRPGAFAEPSRLSAWVATPRRRVPLRSEPAARGKVIGQIVPRTTHRNVTRLLVLGSGVDRTETTWVRLLVTGGRERPTQAWVPVGLLRLSQTPLRLTIDTTRRRMELRRSGRLILRAVVGVGSAATPTPSGLFAIREVIRPGRVVGRAFGPALISLSGSTASPNEFPGEQRRLGLIGLGRNSVRLLNKAPTQGSVRAGNRVVAAVARLASSGTPVDVIP